MAPLEHLFVAASSNHGETEDLGKEFASLSLCTNFFHLKQSLSSRSVHSGTETKMTSAESCPSSSPCYSARIQSLSERRSDFSSELERDIESSKSSWTETSVATSDFDDEEQRVADRVAFERLKEHPEWGSFFRRQPYQLEMGGKIAEGGQAEIFEALGTNKHESIPRSGNTQERTRLVVKVFKKGFSLEDVQRWWPPGLASAALPYRYFPRASTARNVRSGLCFSVGAQLLDDGRFAFIFDRFWGDLRKLIDKRMLKNNGAPPFFLRETYMILRNIAEGMAVLHNLGLLHKDLKAANVLMQFEDHALRHEAFIADFESSVGIIGTGFWRAPEVLLALRNRSLTPETFTRKSDVYSYAMTCYEVLTGRLPFEGHPFNDYDIVLRGERPPLPDDIYPAFKDLLRKCWHEDSLQRPSFHQIVADLKAAEHDLIDEHYKKHYKDYWIKQRQQELLSSAPLNLP